MLRKKDGCKSCKIFCSNVVSSFLFSTSLNEIDENKTITPIEMLTHHINVEQIWCKPLLLTYVSIPPIQFLTNQCME